MRDKLKIGEIEINVITTAALQPGRIILITPELQRDFVSYLLNGGDSNRLPPGWNKERLKEHVVIIENAGIAPLEQDEQGGGNAV